MVAERANPEGFKTCPLCGERWETLADFVHDQSLTLDGYTAFLDDPGRGLVFLTHRRPGCGTTMTLHASSLRALYQGPDHAVFHESADDCRRLCLDRNQLEECDAPCAMAWVRCVLQHLRRHQTPEDEIGAKKRLVLGGPVC